MAASTIDNVLTDIIPLFGVDKLKDEQRTILECLIDKNDCMAVLLTGFGKSLPFQIYSLVNRTTNDKTIVIVMQSTCRLDARSSRGNV
jgi:superfamily II DNA helicase RecQ